MRIVYLNSCGKLGGSETSLREVLASIRAAEPDWELWLVLGEDGPLADIARGLGVEVVVKPFPASLGRLGDSGGVQAGWNLLRSSVATAGYVRDLAGLLGRIKPDIIHTNALKMHLLGAWARPRGTPLIWHIHDYVSARPLMSRFLRLSSGACTLAIANSKSVASDIQGLFPGLRVVPVYNAIDLRRFAPTGKTLDLDAAAGLAPAPSGTVRVGLVATFARWKGHKIFLEAFSRLDSKMPVRGYIIGAPIYQTAGSQWSREELEQARDQLGLAGKVGFTGFLNESDAAMRSLDVVIHASTQPEPFGMVIIEAMACGKAVIASQSGGSSELFEDGENALGHASGDAAALANQIRRLAEDAALRKRLGVQARATAERLYDNRRLSTELRAAYELASQAGPTQRGKPVGAEPELAALPSRRIEGP